MRIAILTSGILPVPAVQGGAVENLIDLYLEYNNRHRIHYITIYSIWHSEAVNHSAQASEFNHYQYIKQDGVCAKIKKYFYRKRHQKEYYHYGIEYFFEQALKRIRKSHYDLIIVENRPGFILKLKQRTQTPCVLHLHNDFLCIDTPKSKELYLGYREIICVSDYIKYRVQDIAPTTDKKCITVYNAIDILKFKNASPAKREDFGLSKNDFILVFSGRIRKEKGILQLILALNKLHEYPNIKLLVVGANAYEKDRYKTSLMKKIEDESQSIKNSIIFTGFINYDNIPSLLKMADVAIVPSMWEEPFGLTVVEAMAAGLPLITTRSGGIPEICEGVATIVQRDNIVDDLADAILDLYNHPEKRKEMSKASLERSRLFDKETYARNFFAALEDVK